MQMATYASRLLVIDAQPDSFESLLAPLAEEDAEVVFARDGAEGHAKALATRPDLILLDMFLPGEGGVAVCRRLKGDTRTADIPVLCMSPTSNLEDKLKAFAHGAVDFLLKPVVTQEAVARIRIHLTTKRRIDRLQSMVAQTVLDRVGDQAYPDEQIFSQALSMLEKQMAKPPRLIDLARALGANERRLTEIFRKRVGMTVFDYFSEVRLETARHLLEASRMRIQTIASHVGYSNAGDFTRAFRRRYGISPRQHRYQCEAEKSPESE